MRASLAVAFFAATSIATPSRAATEPAPSAATARAATEPSPSSAAPASTPSSARPAAPASAPSSARPASRSCTEYLPDGAVRPTLAAQLAERGSSGHVARMTITVTHGRGEKVLPAGFRVERGSEAMRAIEAAGFRVPDPSGGSPPILVGPTPAELADDSKKTVTTAVTLPLLLLPEKAGRHELELVPLPIAIGRANGQVMTLCTPPLRIVVDEPIANEVDPEVKRNPPPRPQREEWLLARQATFAALLISALALLGSYLLYRYTLRPKPAPQKPVLPPWVAARAELAAIRAARLVEAGKLDELVDRVSTCVRRYLGERYGFDGVESTSEEIRAALRRIQPAVVDRPLIEAFLDETDLVKFAKAMPAPSECEAFLVRAETVVRTTTPAHAIADGEEDTGRDVAARRAA